MWSRRTVAHDGYTAQSWRFGVVVAHCKRPQDVLAGIEGIAPDMDGAMMQAMSMLHCTPQDQFGAGVVS